MNKKVQICKIYICWNKYLFMEVYAVPYICKPRINLNSVTIISSMKNYKVINII